MVATVVTERHHPPEEVREWHWSRLLRTYRQVGRTQWERFLMDAQAAEVGTSRAIAMAMGQKNIPKMPDYDSVRRDDAFEPPKRKELPEWMRKYVEANNLPH
jgi:hypothetical protein